MNNVKELLKRVIVSVPLVRNYFSFHSTWGYVGFLRFLFKQVFPVFKENLYVPYDSNSTVYGNILIGKNCKITQRGGCYIQGLGKLFIGDYVEITQNCIVISRNHKLISQAEHEDKETIIGDHCWIASNSLIMAGVVLGPRTVVAAGSVVTKSFPDGYCLIAGNPAKMVKPISREEFIPRHYKYEMYGYIPADKFPAFKKKNLSHIKFHYDLSKVTSNADLILDSIADDGAVVEFAKSGY